MTAHAWNRINLAEIDAVLAALGSCGREVLDPDHVDEAMSPDALRRVGEGYRYVDALLADRVDLFGLGQSRHLLELNHHVLCGVTPERRRQYEGHIEATRRWFYDRPGSGADAFFAWVARAHGQPAHRLAAGAFVQVASTPQLFLEGNNRTATLIASFVLARDGLPPLVATTDNYPRYRFEAERCNAIDRSRLRSVLAITQATQGMAEFFRATGEPRFLLPAPIAPAASAAG